MGALDRERFHDVTEDEVRYTDAEASFSLRVDVRVTHDALVAQPHVVAEVHALDSKGSASLGEPGDKWGDGFGERHLRRAVRRALEGAGLPSAAAHDAMHAIWDDLVDDLEDDDDE